MIALGNYEYNPSHANLLGSGAFAFVYKGHVKNKPDEPVAIKIMKKDTNLPKNKTLLSKEISVLKDLNHENIVRLFDHGVSNNGVYLVMEFCNGGDLSEYLLAKETLPEDTIRHFLIQIGSAMDAINRKGFMHRDLKPGNILLSHCRNCGQSVVDIPGHVLTFKLADFGFARFLQDGMMAVTMCGSPMYMAPEVLMCRKYDAVADIWSMGIIVYQCLTGKAPFYASNPEALKNIYEKAVCLKPKIPLTTTRLLRDLLLRMLVRKPSDRIDFDNFLNHPFLHQRRSEPSGTSAPPRNSTLSVGTARTQSEPTAAETPPPVITNLGQGTSDGPFYLGPRNIHRDRTPQGIRTATTKITDSSGMPDPNAIAHSPYCQKIHAQHELDELDDIMSRTTVDEYFEDELDSSALPLEPTEFRQVPTATAFTRGIGDPPRPIPSHYAPPVPCRGSSARWQPTPQTTDHQPTYPVQQPVGELDVDEAHLEDYVILNPDGSEAACRLLRGTALPIPDTCASSTVGRIMTSRAAYLTCSPRAHYAGSPSSTDYSTPSGNAGYFSPTRTSPRTFSNIDNPTILPHVLDKPPNHPSYGRVTPTHSASPSQPRIAPHRRPSPSSIPLGSHPVVSGANQQEVGRRMQPKSTESDVFIPLIHEDRRIPRASTGRLQDYPPLRDDDVGVTTCPGEFQQTTEVTRQRPHSGAGIIDPGLNAPHVLAAVGLWAANEFCDEQVMDPEHNEEIKTITMVLELCELLTELAERRASVLADCTVTTSSATFAHDASSEFTPDLDDTSLSSPGAVTKPIRTGSEDSGGVECSSPGPTGLRFLSEAQRIVEQIVLYRRVLYYLEYVYVQVKKAVVRRRLKSTATSRRRLNDCNALYHRCYIRLRQLARQSRRDDLIEPVGRLLSKITANRLIFQYALVQCQAAEMDDYVGDIAQSLQRYKAGITLLHGLRQHAKSTRDKALLAECMRLLHDRYNALRVGAAKAHHGGGYFGVTAPLGPVGSSPSSDHSSIPIAPDSSHQVVPTVEGSTIR